MNTTHVLSAIKGVNQAFARFTPFFTPKNVKLGVFVFLRFFKRMSITKRLVFLWTGRNDLYDEKYMLFKKINILNMEFICQI